MAFFLKHQPNMKPNLIAHHFALEGIPLRTTYDIVKMRNGRTMDRKPGSGLHRAVDQKTKDKIRILC